MRIRDGSRHELDPGGTADLGVYSTQAPVTTRHETADERAARERRDTPRPRPARPQAAVAAQEEIPAMPPRSVVASRPKAPHHSITKRAGVATRAEEARAALARHGGDRRAAAAELGMKASGFGRILHAADQRDAAGIVHPVEEAGEAIAERAVTAAEADLIERARAVSPVDRLEAARDAIDVAMFPPVTSTATTQRRPIAVRLAHEAPLALTSSLGRAERVARQLAEILELEAEGNDQVTDLHRRAAKLRRDIAVALVDASITAAEVPA